jgi:hypothetical protein
MGVLNFEVVYMRKIIFATFIFIHISFPVLAQIQIKNIDSMPPETIIEPYVMYPSKGPIKTKMVQEEVYHMQNLLPVIKESCWNVTFVNQMVSITKGDIRGYAIYPNTIYIFQSKNPAEATAHELSHLIRWNYITNEDLNDYIKLRDDGKQHTSFQNTPEELFANDLAGLFGTDMARGSIYKPTYDLPGIKEKAWIGERLGYVMTWQEKLDYFKIYPNKGEEEILRANNAQKEKMAKGDTKGANSAKAWANQIRVVIGLPTVR